MRAPEPMPGIRVVARPEVLDRLAWPAGVTVLRLAADEALGLGASSVPEGWVTAEPEAGFVGWQLTADEVAAQVLPHVEWPLPVARPALAQGLIAGVPAKLQLAVDGRALLLVAQAYAHELIERLP